MHIPIRPVGVSPGLAKGGALLEKLRKLCVVAFPKDMPSYIDVDISSLDLGKTTKVKDLPKKDYIIKEDPSMPIITIGIPRALRSQEGAKALAK